MKKCCETAHSREMGKVGRYFKWFIYLMLLGIIGFLLWEDFSY